MAKVPAGEGDADLREPDPLRPAIGPGPELAGTPASIVVRRLNRLAPLTPATVEILTGLRDSQRLPAGAAVVEAQEVLRPRFLVSGWAARLRWLADGRRQIVSLVLPGDGVGLCERPQPLALCALVALTPVELIDAATVANRNFAGEHRARDLSIALAIASALDEAQLIDQVVRLGRQTALERVAHLLMELRFRLALVDLVEDETMPFPLTQEQLADATGLSAVHVNRTLQQLRRDGLIDLGQGRVRLLKPVQLEALADYQPPEVTRWGGVWGSLMGR